MSLGAADEDGFVLMAALWLLLLGAVLASLLLMRGMTSARLVRGDEASFVAERSVDDAVERIVADLLLAGQASRWARLPSSGSVNLGGTSVAAAVTSEEALVDVNAASSEVIDAALREGGLEAGARSQIVGRILQQRASGHRIASFAETAALAYSVVPAGQEDCLLKTLSPFGRAQQYGGNLAAGGPLRAGSSLRIRTTGAGAHHLIALRMITANDRPYAILDDYIDECAA